MPETRHSEPTRPENAFARAFLRRLAGLDEPSTSLEAEAAGPWRLVPRGDLLALLRPWESLPEDCPRAVFRERQAALLAVAVLPAVGREPTYRLRPQRTAEGFPLERSGDDAGHLTYFEEPWVQALNLLDALARSPVALARLLEATGATALEAAGRALHRSVSGRP